MKRGVAEGEERAIEGPVAGRALKPTIWPIHSWMQSRCQCPEPLQKWGELRVLFGPVALRRNVVRDGKFEAERLETPRLQNPSWPTQRQDLKSQ